MDYDKDRVDDTVLALLLLTLDDPGYNHAWKGFDFRVTNRLCEKGFIENPVRRNESLVLTEEGRRRSEELFKDLFQKHG